MPESIPPDRLQVFLCHSSGDKAEVRAIYKRLQAEKWLYPWLDEEELDPGQEWDLEIEMALEKSHAIVICLSPASITKQGYVQREIRVALELAEYMPEGAIRIIPLLLKPCESIPRRLRRWQWASYYEEQGHERLLKGLRRRAKELGITVDTPQNNPPQEQASPVQYVVEPSVIPVHPPVAPPAPKSAPTEQEQLLRELAQPDTTPQRRLAIGDRLSEIGDLRPGVGTIKVSIDGREVQLPQLEWCEIPAPPGGKFVMGAKDQKDNLRREVELAYSFKMSKYPITYLQFQTFVESGEYDNLNWWQGFPKEYQAQPLREQHNKVANHPRENVSWYQAVAFTRWLTEGYRAAGWLARSLELRLPVETEWEYAARGRDEREYSYLGEFDPTKANTNETGLSTTSAVGCFADGASPFGVLDMSGNVWEWCVNKYSNNEGWRVLRGGAFNFNSYSAVCAYRYHYDPFLANSLVGFRVVGASPIALL